MNRTLWGTLLSLAILLPATPILATDVPDGFSRVVLYATETIDIDKEVEIVSGDVVVGEAGGELKIDKDGTTPAGFRLAADEIVIQQDVVVAGDVAYNELDNDGTILGDLLTPLALPVFASLPPFEAATPGSDDVEVEAGETVTLAAGDYGELDVDKEATLIFSGGVYSFETVKIDKDVRWAFEALSRIRIADKLEVKEGCDLGPADGASIAASDVSFFVGNEAKFEKTCQVSATVFVDGGKLEMKKDIVAVGAFVAREIKIDKNVTLTLDSAFNEGPVAVDDSATVDEGGATSVLDSGEASVLANDSDPNPGDLLAVTTTPVAGPDHGVVVLAADGTFTYTHDGSETLADAFVYEVCDDGFPVHCATATVAITVNPVNDPPTAVDDSATTDEDNAVTIDVLANDSDIDGVLDPGSVSVTSGPASGSTTVDRSTGAVTYTPAADFFGTDSFVYQVCDDGVPPPVLCDSATVTVTVDAVNDAPTILPDQASGLVDQAVTVDVLANDSDIDGTIDPSSVTITTAVRDGIAQVNPDGSITFTPDSGFTGIVTFTYQACDDGVPPPVLCGSALVTIEIFGDSQNIPPVADDAEAQTQPGVPVEIRLTASDGDGDALTFSISSGPSQGTLGPVRPETTMSATVIYTPGSGATGSDTFIFLVDDGNGGADTGTVTVFFDAVNRRPIARNDRIIVTQGGTVTVLASGASSVLDNDTDLDGDALTVDSTPVSGPAHGSLSLLGDGTFSYTHDGGFDTADAFVYRVCDDGVPSLCDTATVAIEIRLDTISVTVQKAGDGTGRVTSAPAGIDCGSVCSADFAGLTRVILSAEADEGSTFDGFSGDADCADGELRGLTDATCVATFTALPPPGDTATLTVVKEGAGRGTVASNPPGIVCGATCSATYSLGTTVALLVRPDDDTSVFAGWSGDPDCTDGLVTMTTDLTCIATFDER